MRITVRWQGNKWYQGICKAYNPVLDEHFIHYLDDDKKWYILANKTWRPVSREPLGWEANILRVLRTLGPLQTGLVIRSSDGDLKVLTEEDCLAANNRSAATGGPTIHEVDGDEDVEDAGDDAGDDGVDPPATEDEEARAMNDEDTSASAV